MQTFENGFKVQAFENGLRVKTKTGISEDDDVLHTRITCSNYSVSSQSNGLTAEYSISASVSMGIVLTMMLSVRRKLHGKTFPF